MNRIVLPLFPDQSIETSSLVVRAADDPAAEAAKPCVLVIPGGGYSCVCTGHEGENVCEAFEKLGFRTAMLIYRVQDGKQAPKEHAFPAALQDGMRAMKLLRTHGGEWGIDTAHIAALGFSAGGHLCGSLGTLTKFATANVGDEADAANPVPDALILCYAVLSGDPDITHYGTICNFHGVPQEQLTQEQIDFFSIEKHVDANTPPAFIWTTEEDTVVPAEHSIRFRNAMKAAGRPSTLVVYPFDEHGHSIALGEPDVELWPLLAAKFLQRVCEF